MSKGEKVYNWVVYSGINYWVNLISSIMMADFLISGKGKKPMGWLVGKTAEALAATGMNMKSAYRNSKTTMETLTLLSGGTLLLVPMKYLEDHKRSVVHWLNDKMGVDQTAPDGHKETQDEIYIECEQPKQSWWSAIKRRLYAIVAVAATGQVIEHTLADKKIIKPDHTYSINPYDPASKTVAFEGHYMGGKEWAEQKIVGAVNSVVKNLPGGETFTKPGSWMQRYLGLAALDTGFTKISAMVMFMTNGAKKAKAPHEINDDIDPPASFEIGDDIKPGEHRETVIVPSGKHAQKLPVKHPEEGYATTLAREAEAAKSFQLSI